MSHVLFIHGAWHHGSGFDRVLESLSSRGIASSTVELSSVARDGEPIGDLASDAALLREAVTALDGDVVVLAHSYGGVVATQALAGLTNVSRIIYLTAFVLDEGESLFAACGSMDPPWWIRSTDGERLTAGSPNDVFYNEFSPEVTATAVTALRTQSLASFMQPVTAVAWREIPSTYVVCTNDQAIPLFAQEHMAARCRDVRRMASDHSPFLSHVEELAELIEQVVTSR